MKKYYNTVFSGVVTSMIRLLFVMFFVVGTFFTTLAYSNVPIATDSRIKTLIYNEAEVFHIVVHYGYQSSIELAKNEEIEIISVGNDYSWKITPVGRRIFIKSLEGAARTNMTVITNKRTYQFEIESKDPTEAVDENLVYVVRFFYPDNNLDVQRSRIDPYSFMPNESKSTPLDAPSDQQKYDSSRPSDDSSSSPYRSSEGSHSPSSFQSNNTKYNSRTISPVESARSESTKSLDLPNYNYNYTLEGPDRPAPLKVFDDGQQTFLQFPNNNTLVPHIFYVDNSGSEQRLSFSRKESYIVINDVKKKLSLKLGDEVVYVYNETM